jgi:hypothetical protein
MTHEHAIEGIADAACDLDSLANELPDPDRTIIKQCASILHDIAYRMAQAEGLTIYWEDGTEQA